MKSDRNGAVLIADVRVGLYILAIDVLGFHETLASIRVAAGEEFNAGRVEVPVIDGCIDARLTYCASPIIDYVPLKREDVATVPDPRFPSPPTVLTVCEALEGRDAYDFNPVVIVGIFKSGLDETLRQDCPNQLVAGDIGFMSAIALTRPTEPPDSLRAEIEKKRAIVLASGPPGAHPRPERVTALYGRLVSPSGLTSIPCCTAPVEINAAPARLLGLDERDFRVLR